jgi:hypothetical protein
LPRQRLELAPERRHRALQPPPVAVQLELLPGAEQAPGDVEAPLAEFLLRGQPLGVGGEVSDRVRPAELAAAGVEAAVGPPAVGPDDTAEVLAEQGGRLALVAVGGDPEDRGSGAQGTPERAPGSFSGASRSRRR